MLASIARRAAVAAALGLAAAPGAAQEAIPVEEVPFAPGATTATVEGTASGYDAVGYGLEAQAGQTLRVRMQTERTMVYFNVLPPEGGALLHAGARQGHEFAGTLREEGTYVVEVFLARAAARRNESAGYALTFEISGEAAAPGAD